jgi:preprotein translocase subunit SecG
MKPVDNALIVLVSIICIGLMFVILNQSNKIKELEILMDEQQLLDQIGKQMVASRLNINIR